MGIDITMIFFVMVILALVGAVVLICSLFIMKNLNILGEKEQKERLRQEKNNSPHWVCNSCGATNHNSTACQFCGNARKFE